MTAAAHRSPRGTVLIMVMVMVAMLAIVAVSEMFLIRGEVGAAAAGRDGVQARAAAMSGIYRAIAVLTAEGDEPIDHRDNPELFQAQPLTDAEDAWEFTVFADNPDDPDNLRYGLIDEAGKINLNLTSDETLKALGLTDELAECLRDWLDSDDDPHINGAEQEYYQQLPRPYTIRNGPLGTLEELLLVKGFTGSIVYGEDANANGLLEPNECDGDESFPPDDGDSELNRGLRYVATTITHEPNVDSEGNPRININQGSGPALAGALRDAGFGNQVVQFLGAVRGAGVPIPDPSALLGMTLEVKVSRPGPGGATIETTITLTSGVTAENLPLVMDRLTSGGIPLGGQEILIGRVNLLSAPVEVLLALPGLDENLAQEIVATRETLDFEEQATTAWLVTRGVVSDDTFKKVAPSLTTRSYQYTVRSFGYKPGSGQFCVLEAVVDLASGQPRIMRMRDMTRLGVPFVPEGVER